DRVVTGCTGEALQIVEARAAEFGAPVWRLGEEVTVESESLGWDGHRMTVSGPGFEHRDLRLSLVGDYQPDNAALAVAAAHLLDDVDDDAVRAGLAAARWPGRLQAISHHPQVILDGGHNPAAMVKAGAALRRLIGDQRLVPVFGMLSERDPVQLLAALRTLRPDAVVFTEPASAQGPVIAPGAARRVVGPGLLGGAARRGCAGARAAARGFRRQRAG